MIVFAQLMWGHEIYNCYQLNDNAVTVNRFYFFILIDNRKSARDTVIDVNKFTLYHKYTKKFLPIIFQSKNLYRERRTGVLAGFHSSHIVKSDTVHGGVIFCDLPKNIITFEELQLYYNEVKVKNYFIEPLRIQHLSLHLPVIFYDSKNIPLLLQKKIEWANTQTSLSGKEFNLEPLMFYYTDDKKYIYVVVSVWGNDKLYAKINSLYQQNALYLNCNFTYDFAKKFKINIKNNEYLSEGDLSCVSLLYSSTDYKDILSVRFKVQDIPENLSPLLFFYDNKKYMVKNKIRPHDERFLLPRALSRMKSIVNAVTNIE